ncbi:hypothetical protein AHF37_08445 [Paragonimus kellicotti]|nr:hypothetical protein AHF37_08445 [Paragonimus kellicotti]
MPTAHKPVKAQRSIIRSTSSLSAIEKGIRSCRSRQLE